MTFAWWKRRLRPRGESAGTPPRPAGELGQRGGAGFVEVALPRDAAFGRLGGFVYELALPGGACLRVGGDFDPERVARLLQVLAATC